MARNESVYDDVFQTARYFHPRLFIPYINQHFSKSYSMDAVIQMVTRDGRLIEKKASGRIAVSERESDMVILIDGDPYLIECQSYNDQMEIRIAEYTFMSASRMAKRDNDGTLVIEMPRYSVIYVRSNNNTPHETRIRFRFPDGNEIDYMSKNTVLSDYSVSDIINKRLYPLIPFYITRYEKAIADESRDVKDASEALEQLMLAMENWVEAGELSSIERSDLLQYTKTVIEHIADGNRNEERLVNKMGGKIFITPAQQMLIDSWNDGMAEGMAEGEVKGSLSERAETVLELLEGKGMIDDGLRNRITSEKDIAVLRTWFKKAVKCGSVDEFCAVM